MCMKTKQVLGGLFASMLLSTTSANAIIAYDNPVTLLGNEAVPFALVLGMDFQVNAGYPISVTAIGAFDNGLNGFGLNSIPVAIYNVTTMTMVPGTMVTFTGLAGTPAGSSRFLSISPVLLGPGTYSIVAANYGNLGTSERDYNSGIFPPAATPPTFNTGGGALTMLSHRETFGASLVFPTTTFFAGPNPEFGAGTFDFTPVPEAATFGFAGLALLGLCYIGRAVWLKRSLVA